MPYKDEEKRKEYNQEYYQKNKDRVLAQKKEYYQQHKERYNERYTKNKDRHRNIVKRNHTNANNKSRLTAPNYNRIWSSEEKEMLSILKAEGIPSSQIAMLLGRTIRSVENMSFRIKTKGDLKDISNKQNSEELEAMDELMDLIVAYYLVSKE
jgi:hypothetical protein